MQTTDPTIHLIMADLINGVTVLFGVRTHQDLEEYMAEGDGHRFIPAIDTQMLVTVKYVMCPKCEALTVTNEQACTGCGLPFGSPEMIQALQAGKARLIPRTKYVLKALADGSENNTVIRPAHILSYDTISKQSKVFKEWASTAEKARAQLAEFNSGIKVVEKNTTVQGPRRL